MAVAALTYDPGTNVIDIDATIPADTPDEASIFELRPATPGGFSKVWHSASKNQTIKVAGAPPAFSLHHIGVSISLRRKGREDSSSCILPR